MITNNKENTTTMITNNTDDAPITGKVKDNQQWQPTTDGWDGVNDFGGLPKPSEKKARGYFLKIFARCGVQGKTWSCEQNWSNPWSQTRSTCNNHFLPVCLSFYFFVLSPGWSRLLSELPSLGQKSASKRSLLRFHTFQSHGNGNRSNSVLMGSDISWFGIT